MNNQFFQLIKAQAKFYTSPIHGIAHWQRVENYGLYLADFSNADKVVVSYFAYLHDLQRENENKDPEHGLRAAQFIDKHADQIDLSESQLSTLIYACQHHTKGRETNCATVATCWDADRLDLTRLGIEPNENYLLTTEAKRIAIEKDFKLLRSLF
ncbi:HD domain-containing protein [Thiomicrorhabdus chilensis]|uniref:hypothetical protein n=1 Tax=Thiomicrorhabdus chilensis TaxID=63656 RepID=UPI000685C185|nr:hypothetical protein [Thiomicrorhabdus chilensis]